MVVSAERIVIFMMLLWATSCDESEDNKKERISVYQVSTNASNSIFFDTTHIENIAIFGLGESVLAALVAALFGFSLTNFLGYGSSSNSELAKFGFEQFTHDKQNLVLGNKWEKKSPNLLGVLNASLQKSRDKFEEAVKKAEKIDH